MNDLFGKAFLYHLEHGNSPAIEVHIDEVLQDPLDPAYFFRSYERMPKLEQAALKRCGKKVLDVGAAAGCHSLWLQEHGHEVTALEQSPGACEVMRRRGIRKVVEADFFKWESPERYDTILMLMNGLGIGQDLEGTIRLLEKAKSLLKPSGELLGDSSDIAYFDGSDDEENTNEADTKKEDRLTDDPLSYYGLVQFHLKWNNEQTDFNWVYPDPELLRFYAHEVDLSAEVIAEGEHHDALLSFRHQMR